ncbi:MAG: hypothetical protein IT461_08965 [Planctomycetes bacterium]|nr:hypothetical protein [Planctomycetota bacterium]
MSSKDNAAISKLAKVFRKLGANDPEGWAKSQVSEGIPQLARFAFLKAAWQEIVDDADASWISSDVEEYEQRPDAPYSGAGRALKRMKQLGVNENDIVDLVRAKQANLLFNFCSLLDGASIPEFMEEIESQVAWVLMNIPESGVEEPKAIGGLLESVLETDPSGREMRPRPESPKRKT